MMTLFQIPPYQIENLRCSQLDIVKKISQWLMSSKSISNFLLKILTCVIQSNGGLVGKPSFPIYVVSLATCYVFLVSKLLIITSFLTMTLMLGSAVAVEHVFSGWDTISLCYANLNPNTIHILCLLRAKYICPMQDLSSLFYLHTSE